LLHFEKEKPQNLHRNGSDEDDAGENRVDAPEQSPVRKSKQNEDEAERPRQAPDAAGRGEARRRGRRRPHQVTGGPREAEDHQKRPDPVFGPAVPGDEAARDEGQRNEHGQDRGRIESVQPVVPDGGEDDQWRGCDSDQAKRTASPVSRRGDTKPSKWGVVTNVTAQPIDLGRRHVPAPSWRRRRPSRIRLCPALRLRPRRAASSRVQPVQPAIEPPGKQLSGSFALTCVWWSVTVPINRWLIARSPRTRSD